MKAKASVKFYCFLVLFLAWVLASRPVVFGQTLSTTESAQETEERLRGAVREAETTFGQDSKELLKPLEELARYYQATKRHKNALDVLERILLIEQGEYGPEHFEVGGTLGWMGGLYRDMGAHDAAESLLLRSLEMLRAAVLAAEKQYGPNAKEMLAPLYELGDYFVYEKKHAEALVVWERVLTIEEQVYGREHKEVASTLRAIANSHENLGDYAKAERFGLRALTIEKSLARDYRNEAGALSATILNNAGERYRSQGRYAEAELHYLDALAIERRRGIEDSEVAIILNNLGLLYKDLGLYTKAEPLFLEALGIVEKAKDPEHQIVATFLNNLGELYGAQDRYSEAELFYRRALTIREKIFESDHRSVARSLKNLAGLYLLQGRYSEAEPLFQRALTITEKAPPDHSMLATILNNLALVYDAQGLMSKAESFHLRALDMKRNTLNPEHSEIAVSLNNLAMFYEDQGSYSKAESLHLEALTIWEKALGADHPNVGTNQNNLAGLYEKTGQHEKVLPHANRALLIAIDKQIPDLLWRAYRRFQVAFAREGKTDLATFFGKQAVNTIQSMRGNLSSQNRESLREFLQDKTDVYRKLADLLIDEGRLPEAQEVLSMLKEEELYDFVTRSGDADSRTTTSSLSGIEETWHKRYQDISGRLGGISFELEELDKKAKFNLTEDETKRRELLRSDRRVAQQAFDKFLGDLIREFDAASAQRNRELGERNLASLRGLQDTLTSLGRGAVALHYVMGEGKL